MVKQMLDKKDVGQMDLLQAFEIIVEKAKGSSLGKSFIRKQISILVLFPINCVSPSEQVSLWPSLPTDVMIPISGFLI